MTEKIVSSRTNNEGLRMKAVLSLVLALVPTLSGAEKQPSPIGKTIAPFTLRDFRGAERSWKEFAANKLIVVAFTGTECPLAKLYGPRLAELARDYEPKGVAFIGI